MKRSAKEAGISRSSESYQDKRTKEYSISDSVTKELEGIVSPIVPQTSKYGKNGSNPDTKSPRKSKSHEIDETKEEDKGEISLGDISFSDLKSDPKSSGKKSEQQAKLDRLDTIIDSYNNLEEIEFENQLFIIKSVELVNKKQKSEGLRIFKITLKLKDAQYKDFPLDFTCTLKHSWNRIILEEGDTVRVIGKFSKKNSFSLLLDDIPIENEADKLKRARFLVLEPDILIPSTAISTSSPCARVPLLRELFKNAEGDPNYALILGNIVHLVFQKILDNIPDLYIDKAQHKVDQAIKESMQDQLVSLYLLKSEYDETRVINDVYNAIQMIYKWLDSFQEHTENQFQLKFVRQIAAEQEIHSYIYGVKGKIDSTVLFKDEKNNDKVTAVELKTGKYESQSHLGQVRLYCMILDEVFKNPGTKHLLVYILKDSKNVSIVHLDNEAKALIQNRNIMCKYKKSIRLGNYHLPPLIKDDRTCNKCFSKDVCCINAMAFDQLCNDKSEPAFAFYQNMKKNTDPEEIAYFKNWIELINLEQIAADRNLYKKAKEKNAEAKEEKDKTVQDSEKPEENKESTVSKIEEEKEPQIVETKVKPSDLPAKQNLPKKLTLESSLSMTKAAPTTNGFIVYLQRDIDVEAYKHIQKVEELTHQISELDEQAYVILRPTVTSIVFTRGLIIKKNYYLTTAEKKKRVSELPELENTDSAQLEYIVEFTNEEYYNVLEDALGGRKYTDLKWKLQKEPFSNYSFSVMRSNVFQVLCNPDVHSIKDIALNLAQPVYDTKLKKNKFEKDQEDLIASLDNDQKTAVFRSVASINYHIVDGPSKSGKTTVIASLLQYYEAAKMKVLLVAQRNEDLDNVLLQVQSKDIPFVRISSGQLQVHPDIRENIKTASSFKNTNEIDQMIETQHIYAATCLSCQNAILSMLRPFDVCIIENAGIINEPTVLGSLLLSKKFIMVGDKTKNLIAQHHEAKERGFENSLFHRLIEENEKDATFLTSNYDE